MKIILAIFFAFVCSAQAQLLYLEMKETVTNMWDTPVYLCVPVVDKADAETQKVVYAADEDFFKDIDYTAVYHIHVHGEVNQPCVTEPLKKMDMSKYVEMISEEVSPFMLPITFRLPVTDKQDASRKEQKIKQMFPGKTFKVKKHGVET